MRRGRVAVVGAGPAGARAAELLAAGGFEVLLFDPRAPWEKPCGGGIPAHAFDHFPELRELGRNGRWIREARFEAPAAGGLDVQPAEPLLLVDRRELACFQLERATAAGAVRVARRVHEVMRRAGGFRLLDDEGVAYDVAFLIGADGASSRVRRLLSPALQPRQLPTRGRFVPIARDADTELIVRFLPGLVGYVWEFPRGESCSVGVCDLEGERARAGLEEALLSYFASREGSAAHPEYGHPIPLLRPEDCRAPARFGAAEWALCGDAAGLVDPITGEGIHHALRSGELAARALLEYGSLAAYPRRLAREVLGELRAASRYAGRFYQPGFTDALLQACRRGPHLRAALADLVAGRQTYCGLRRRTLGALLRDRIWGEAGRALLRFVGGELRLAPGRSGG
ncbi:MAG: NAD(P)/FAD-dependent oxidoreductase [Gemmatimonadetes bacterium]|nr:NAD(P)/FAD-dependent oxidoreductase [Gemmatimonadota bacterium]